MRNTLFFAVLLVLVIAGMVMTKPYLEKYAIRTLTIDKTERAIEGESTKDEVSH